MANTTVTLDLNIEQIENLVEKFNLKQKIQLLDKLAKETRKARWNDLIKRIHARAAKYPVSDAEITKICKQVRSERYEKRTESSR